MRMKNLGTLARESRLLGALLSVALALFAAAVMANGARAQEVGCTGDVVLDPGHGGSDSGASYTFPEDNSLYPGTVLYEKDQNLLVAQKLESLLEANGYTVCMTRTGDQTLSNNDRYTYANTTGAKLLVSVHMNGASDSSVDYTTALFGKWRKDKALAETVLYEGLAGLRAVDESADQEPKDGLLDTRSPYSFASGVLLKSDMPAIIAETVFITNGDEARLLAADTRQYEIAEALRAGVESYLLSSTQPDSEDGGGGDSGGHPKGGPPGKKK